MSGLLELEEAQPRSEPAVSLRLDSAGNGLRLVREQVRTLLGGYPDAVVVDAVQVADELASNAYYHGDAPMQVHLTLLDAGTRLRVEASDSAVFALPEVRGGSSERSRGMLLVSRLAAA